MGRGRTKYASGSCWQLFVAGPADWTVGNLRYILAAARQGQIGDFVNGPESKINSLLFCIVAGRRFTIGFPPMGLGQDGHGLPDNRRM
jgi:hypothetical protein